MGAKHPRTRRRFVVLALGLPLFAACGDGGDHAGKSTANPTPSVTATVSPTPSATAICFTGDRTCDDTLRCTIVTECTIELRCASSAATPPCEVGCDRHRQVTMVVESALPTLAPIDRVTTVRDERNADCHFESEDANECRDPAFGSTDTCTNQVFVSTTTCAPDGEDCEAPICSEGDLHEMAAVPCPADVRP